MKTYNALTLQPPARIGIVGGGQLGKMMAAEAKRMGYYVVVLDPTPASPAAQVVDRQIIAAFNDSNAIRELAQATDVMTYEFEHINAEILCELEAEGFKIFPSGHTLQKIKNKFIQKSILAGAGLPVPEFTAITSERDIAAALEQYGYPAMLKTCYGGYDGKGNCLIRGQDEIPAAFSQLCQNELMLEKFVDFTCELSVMVARDFSGKITTYPVAENVHRDSILRITRVPAAISPDVQAQIDEITVRTLTVLDDVGVYCIEMFLDKNNRIYINEIAPRPHNSGHYTIEACPSSQYEQIIRIITGMPLGSAKLISPCVMVNILGNDQVIGPYTFAGVGKVLAHEDVHLHLYGKHATQYLKKIGHITALNPTVSGAEQAALQALEDLQIIAKESV